MKTNTNSDHLATIRSAHVVSAVVAIRTLVIRTTAWKYPIGWVKYHIATVLWVKKSALLCGKDHIKWVQHMFPVSC